LLGVRADEKTRLDFLTKERDISERDARALILRDKEEHLPNGQKLSETFHLSDIFLRIGGHDDDVKQSI